MQQMLQQLLAMQEKEEANIKADLAKLKADEEKIQAEMEAIRAETKAMRDKRMETRWDD
jgi:septal ring factor EnvC (AmiA/AmiB activator)